MAANRHWFAVVAAALVLTSCAGQISSSDHEASVEIDGGRSDADASPKQCHSLLQTGLIPTRQVVDAMPEATGGTIPNGVYRLVREGVAAQKISERSRRMTWRLIGDTLESVSTDATDPMASRLDVFAVTFTKSASWLLRSTCSSTATTPASEDIEIGYTINDGATLTVIFTPSHFGVFERRVFSGDAGCDIVAPCP